MEVMGIMVIVLQQLCQLMECIIMVVLGIMEVGVDFLEVLEDFMVVLVGFMEFMEGIVD
jgi:hypothetical protein